MSSEFKPAGRNAVGSPQKQSGATTAEPGIATVAPLAKISAPAMSAQKSEATYKCPKCGTDAREVARFCPRCHATLRFECPSCGNRQRIGGKCEKCGVDFIKYIGAVVAAKKAEADAIHDRLESRSSFLKAVLFLPVNGGVSLLRHFFKRDRD